MFSPATHSRVDRLKRRRRLTNYGKCGFCGIHRGENAKPSGRKNKRTK